MGEMKSNNKVFKIFFIGIFFILLWVFIDINRIPFLISFIFSAILTGIIFLILRIAFILLAKLFG